MAQNINWRNDIDALTVLVGREIESYLNELDDMPAKPPMAEESAKSISTQFPEGGLGAVDTLRKLITLRKKSAVASAGPRCFHFVVGGSTPASMGADWLATLYDQIAYAWVSSPLAVQLEIISLQWLSQFFGIPKQWGSIITSGATMSNFVGLIAGRQWLGEQLGIDVAEEGLSEMPRVSVFTSGHIHASTLKALAMLGIGRGNVLSCTHDNSKDLDLNLLESRLKEYSGAPCILVATAGEPNAGAFDPIDKMASLTKKYGCWLHLDGAFGLFAKLSPRTEHLVQGLEKADSITVDGHKWLNVPYDCGFSFVRDKSLLIKSFRYTAEYLPGPHDPEPVMGAIGPESSRRARSFSVWATIHAYGLKGYRQLIEHHLDLAQYLEQLVNRHEQLELLAPVLINVVCFRYNPGQRSERALNSLNKMLGDAIIKDGRVYVGFTTYQGKTALRPAISNWRTEKIDIDLLIDVILELGQHLESED